MASYIAGTSRPLSDPGEIREQIEVILKGPYTRDLQAKVLRLIKDFKAAQGLKELPKDLHTKFGDWLRLASPALETSTKVASAAQHVLATAGGSASPAPTRSPTWVVNKEEGLAYYTELLRRLPGVDSPEFTSLVSQAKSLLKVEHKAEIMSASVLYIINKMALLCREWRNPTSGTLDVTSFNHLHIFLRTLGKPKEQRRDKFIQFFITMLIGMDLHKSPSLTTEAMPSPNEADPVFMYAFMRIIRNEDDYEYEPEVDAPDMVEPTARTSTITTKTPPIDPEDGSVRLLRDYNAGCIAAEQLAKMTIVMSNCVNVTLDRVVIGDVDQKYVDGFKASQRQAVKLELQNSRLRGATTQDTMQLNIKYASFTLSCLEAELYICELHRQYAEFAAHSACSLRRLEQKLQAIQTASESSPEQRSLQFSLMGEFYEEILEIRNLNMSYLLEIIEALKQAIILNELKTYLTIFRNDREADTTLLLTKGFQEALLDYKKKNPTPKLQKLSREDRDSVSDSLQKASGSNDFVLTLTGLYKELSESNGRIDRTYSGDFTRLLKLHQSGCIFIDRTTGLTEFRAAHPSTLLRAEAPVAPAAGCVEEPLLRETLAEAAVKATKADRSTLRELSSGANLLGSLQEIAPISDFTVIEARHAYRNALHYIGSLYEILTEPRTISRDAKSIAHLQMDIGFAAFHALEQLLTAFMLEQSKTSGVTMGPGKAGVAAKQDNSALFNKIGHSLIRRLLGAKIHAPDSVRSVLKATEEMEFAIRDLLKRDKKPPLLKFTEGLLTKPQFTPLFIAKEERKFYNYGYNALLAFTSLISVSSCKDLTSDYLDPYLSTVKSLIPAGATDGVAAHFKAPSHALATAGKISAPPVSTKASSILPVDMVHADGISELITTINQALEKATNKESAMSRQLTLIHNLHRYNHLIRCVLGNSKLELFPFYVNQARFVLRTIMEEFLCAALENRRGTNLDQEEQTHNLIELASSLKLTSIGPEEAEFLRESASIRNEARYGHKVKAHSLPSPVSRFEIAATGLEAPESDSELGLGLMFERVLGERYATMERALFQEFSIVKSLSDKISSQFFKEEKKAGEAKK